jgi:hypothetical protein
LQWPLSRISSRRARRTFGAGGPPWTTNPRAIALQRLDLGVSRANFVGLASSEETIEHVGNDLTGFSLHFCASPPCVRVRAWGFWGAELASSFGGKVRDACRGRPAGTTLELDMKNLKPMREEGQLSFSALIAALPALGIEATVIATSSQLTKLQLLRLAGGNAKAANIRFV